MTQNIPKDEIFMFPVDPQQGMQSLKFQISFAQITRLNSFDNMDQITRADD